MLRSVLLALALGCASASATEHLGPSEGGQLSQRPRSYSRKIEHEEIESHSVHVQMSDGVRLAVDVHLPKALTTRQRAPAILHQTRYWRSLAIRFPASLFADGYFIAGGRTKKYFVQRGYAWVDVDVRGTGASFGKWKHSYWHKEISDGAEIVEWIIRQPWSDGQVAAWGKSYAGGAAEFLLVNQHPSVKAAVPMYSPFDVYDDIGWPGGVFSSWYVGEWARLNAQLDQNVLPVNSLRARLFVAGAKPVDGDDGDRLLQEAFETRTQNTDVAAEAAGVVFRGDSSPNISSVDAFSPHAFSEAIKASGTPIYSYSGWYDGGYQHAAIKRFLTYNRPGDRLIVGPWDHGGHHNSSPFVQAHATFDHNGEVLKFFDYHVMGIDTGIEREAPVHYYTMGAEEWRAADSWPPDGSQPVVYYMRLGGTLERMASDEPSAFDEYQADFDVGTGTPSRWTALVGAIDSPKMYTDWNTRANTRLHYVSARLDRSVEVTGHPMVTLYVSSTATDGNFFAYLEDVDPDRNVTYVTEGMLRALHRESVATTPAHQDAVPIRRYDRASAKRLEPGEIVELTFDLFPISYVFERGHSIRVSIAGADKDHFWPTTAEQAPVVRLFRDATYQSQIVLPTMSDPPAEP
jgi:putative CocE/NonD family hydrolase